MKTRKVIAFSALPNRLPIWQGAIVWLLLDRFKPPQWVWGATLCFYAILFGAIAVSMAYEIKVDIFAGREK